VSELASEPAERSDRPSAHPGERLVVILAVPTPEPSPVPHVSASGLEAALLADAVDAAESLAAAGIAVLCAPWHADGVTAAAAIDTTVWTSRRPTVLAAAERARLAGARQVAVLASDAPQLPGLLVGKLFRALARSDVAICPDPRGLASAIGLRLPTPEWLDDIDLDWANVADRVTAKAPRRSLVRLTPGWPRLRSAADFEGLDAAVEGADLTRALVSDVRSRRS
jgi:glycosyltransferase A (GT-A) superfamily protein (DUF2064 family)